MISIIYSFGEPFFGGAGIFGAIFEEAMWLRARAAAAQEGKKIDGRWRNIYCIILHLKHNGRSNPLYNL